MDATNTLLEAALVHADEDAVMRKEIDTLIRRIVCDELEAFCRGGDLNTLGGNLVAQQEYAIKRIALRALKEQFNNPQAIY